MTNEQEQVQRRKAVVALHGEGVPVMQIVQRTGLSWGAVHRAIKRYQAEGVCGLVSSPRGRKPGSGAALSEDQQRDVRQLIRHRPPWFYRLKHSLWTRRTVQELLSQRLEVNLTDRAVGNYLDDWGLAVPPKPPNQRCSPAVAEWLASNYSNLWKRALDEGVPIYWLNKTRKLDPSVWGAPQANGTTSQSIALRRRSMVSVTNKQGKLMWRVIEGAFNADQQLIFLKALLKDTAGGRAFIIRNDMTDMSSASIGYAVTHGGIRVRLFPCEEDKVGVAETEILMPSEDVDISSL